ncbi:MAG TPA: sigma-70 family RNA polymerase sigma factor [Phycisphaerae bacterium]|nr:sigma-70 family RNA polymerase sigma factor [Phycisphaerae bacterium]HNU47037.1 sigma-70 family RNA polymerase sigma factor [Phycisphaerae bacterium]
MVTTVTSPSLLEELRAGGNQEAWQEFFQRYAPMLLAIARGVGLRSSDVDDAVQETLVAVLRLFRRLDQPFDRTRRRFKAWLRGVVLHKVRDVQRRALRAQRLAEGMATCIDPHAEAERAQAVFELEWQRNRLQRALDEVAREVDPATFQEFELYALQGQNVDNVADLFETSRNAIYIAKCRILCRLKETVARLEQEEG